MDVNQEPVRNAHGGDKGLPPLPDTCFAPADRENDAEIAAEVKILTHHPLVDGLMYVTNGLFAVLNDHRQIVTINESFLRLIGVDNAANALGLRPGELIHCVHACELPGGCGTSPYCATCGAVISIMAALKTEAPHEDKCAVTVEKEGKEVDLYFQVRCCPIKVADRVFVLFFLQDITVQQQRANLDSTFFHDINNLLTGLIGKCELYQCSAEWDEDRFADIQKLIMRMAQEFSMQRALTNSISHSYQPFYCTVTVSAILADLAGTFQEHPLCIDRSLQIETVEGQPALLTDQNLVNRILVNMVTNALEATEPGGTVKVSAGSSDGFIHFTVWNRKHIPPDHALKIFKRNFSTKEQLGHGLGTYSMKFFGEQVLGGSVHFTSTEADGTTFTLTLSQR